jgi:hypothetical protein
MGLGRLSKVARLTEHNCRLNIRSLTLKLALEEIGIENSRAGIGKTYRVHSYTTILERRRAAGMEWVIRTKGVRFVNPDGGAIVSTPPLDSIGGADSIGGLNSMGGIGSGGGPPLGSGGGPPLVPIPPYRNSFRNTSEETSSSDAPVLVARMADLGISLDDDVARRIVRDSQSANPTVTVDEIAHFAEVKVKQLLKRKNIENWPGMLRAAVPAYFNPPATELSRYRAGKQREQEKQEQIARDILADPQSAEEEREWARSVVPPPEN